MYVTLLPNGFKLHHNTSFFREPYVFKYLPKYIKERFPEAEYPDGITINIGACSRGEDVWSLIMALEAEREFAPDNYSINASDINKGVVNLARSGILSFLPRTLNKAREVVPDIDEFFESMPSDDPRETDRQELFTEYQRLVAEGGFKRKVGAGETAKYVSVKAKEARLSMLYKVSDKLKRKVNFKTIDFTKEFKTKQFNNPCLILFRNAMQHFSAKERESFAKALYDSLKRGSSLVIGEGDIAKVVPLKLIDAGFEPLNPNYNRDYYRNHSSDLIRSKDPTVHIFEKN